MIYELPCYDGQLFWKSACTSVAGEYLKRNEINILIFFDIHLFFFHCLCTTDLNHVTVELISSNIEKVMVMCRLA